MKFNSPIQTGKWHLLQMLKSNRIGWYVWCFSVSGSESTKRRIDEWASSVSNAMSACAHTYTDTHTCLMALCRGLSGWASNRKVKTIQILLKQETVSGSGISWDICKSAPRSRQITMPAPHHSVFYRPDALPATKPTVSKHCRLCLYAYAHILRIYTGVLNCKKCYFLSWSVSVISFSVECRFS